MERCKTSNDAVSDHFVDVNEMVKIDSGIEKQINEIMLSRFP